MKIHRILPCVLISYIIFGDMLGSIRIHNADELRIAFDLRMGSARLDTISNQPTDPTAHNNGDDFNVPNFAGSHIKGFQHDPVTGILTPVAQQSYMTYRSAIMSGDQATFNAVQRAPGATKKFVNPQGALAFSYVGHDSSLMFAPIAPNLASNWAAAEIIELYLQELSRDVLFSDYGTGRGTDVDLFNGGSITNNAAAVLQALGPVYQGPRNSSGMVDATVLFRGPFSLDLIGPYVSQFLYFPFHTLSQPLLTVNRYLPAAQKREFGVSWTDFIALQNGTVPKPYLPSDFAGLEYIIKGRDLATLVHNDVTYEAWFYAFNVLTFYNFPFSPALPYYNSTTTNEAGFVTMAAPDIATALGLSNEGCKAAWMNKFRCDRRLRPEEFGGLVQQVLVTGTNPYNLSSLIFTPLAGINVMSWVYYHNGLQATAAYDPNQLLTPTQARTYLLSQVYPEGCPLHPSYPSGHAAVAGACATVLKAFFDDTVLISSVMPPVIPSPVDPTILIPLSDGTQNQLTVGGELDKMAWNIAMGRDWAGIHYRTDAQYGILLGEQVGIYCLQDYARQYNEETFTGFVFTKFDGTRIQVTATTVRSI